VTPTRAKILVVVGARPNFVKVAPVLAAAKAWNASPQRPDVCFDVVLVHTGQHYDPLLSDVFFDQLGMPAPDENLGVGSGSQALQTARLLEALEPVLIAQGPDLVLVPGDVNSTCAAALAAAKLDIPVAHLEAGLRSGDRTMPEEVNRIVADHLSDLLFTTCADGDDNLAAEGLSSRSVVRVGNTMIDSLMRLLPAAEASVEATRDRLGLPPGAFVLVTLHRPSNVDREAQLSDLLGALSELGADLPVVFPVHPRTRPGLKEVLRAHGERSGLLLVDPLGYLEFLGLMADAAAVVTDSGGIQEETTALGVPCVTARTTTERPITVTEGTNRLVDPFDPAAVLAAARGAVAEGPCVPPPRLDLWDGRAGARVVEAIAGWLVERPSR
jgi:UDP-N-acetylglucosamine 2-epimerase (non-hydrolysing)